MSAWEDVGTLLLLVGQDLGEDLVVLLKLEEDLVVLLLELEEGVGDVLNGEAGDDGLIFLVEFGQGLLVELMGAEELLLGREVKGLELEQRKKSFNFSFENKTNEKK